MEGLGHLLGGREAVRRLLGERALQHGVEPGKGWRKRRRRLLQRGAQHLDDQRAGERGPTGERLVEHHADGKEIGAAVHGLAQDLLGGHVARGADQVIGVGDRRPADRGAWSDHLRGKQVRHHGRHLSHETEVEQARTIRSQVDVRGLEIAMHQPRRVDHVQRRQHAGAERHDFLGRHRLALEPRGERLAAEQLHRQEGAAFVFADLVQLADVRMAEPRHRFGLTPEAGPSRFVDRLQPLDRDASAEHLVLGLEHGAHAALADLAHHAVAADRRRRAPAPHAAQASHHPPPQARLRNWARSAQFSGVLFHGCRGGESERMMGVASFACQRFRSE